MFIKLTSNQTGDPIHLDPNTIEFVGVHREKPEKNLRTGKVMGAQVGLTSGRTIYVAEPQEDVIQLIDLYYWGAEQDNPGTVV